MYLKAIPKLVEMEIKARASYMGLSPSKYFMHLHYSSLGKNKKEDPVQEFVKGSRKKLQDQGKAEAQAKNDEFNNPVQTRKKRNKKSKKK